MNKVFINYSKLRTIVEDPGLMLNGPDILVKYLDLSWLTLDNYCVVGTHKQPEKVTLPFYIEVVDIQNCFINDEDWNEISPNVKQVIHFVNFGEKLNPEEDLYDGKSHVLSQFEMYIIIQLVTKNNEKMIDLFVCPPLHHEKRFKEFSGHQLEWRAFIALSILEYIEQRFKKEKHRIKRIMPTPEQKSEIEDNNKKYESKPIRIKDIVIQYVYEPHKTRCYQRHCEAWGVRGHYRHYKNGKKIYIKPHIKGQGRLKITEYII